MAPRKNKEHDKKNQLANVPEVVSEAEPSSSYEKSKAKDDNLQNNNEDLLNILEKLIQCLKSAEMKIHIVPILKSLLHITDFEEKKKKMSQNLMCTFLNNLEQCDVEELTLISNSFEDIFIPPELRKLMTKDTNFIELELLGEGSCGTVYKGLLCKDGKQKIVAIKVSKDDHPVQPKFLKNEAKVMCQLKHPNIVQILAFQKNPLKFAMEHMNMGNLSMVLKVKNMTNKMLLKIVHDVASGMEYLAQNNFVHRDLKLNNVFVDKDTDMICKIGDFGTCCYVGQTGGVYHEKELTLTQFLMSPEARETQTFSVKSDVYAMGTLIWSLYMIAGGQRLELSGFQIFFPFVSPLEVIFHQFHNTGKLDKPRRIQDTFFQFVKTKMLSRNPEKRPSFTEIKEEITKLM